jgi:hypothetical protein
MDQPGIYRVLYCAVGDDGFGLNLAAEPLARVIDQGVKNSAREAWTLYE